MTSEDYRPYAFLSALDGSREEDREILSKTRGSEVNITGHMVLASKLATIYAFSGNGKTSLINAGLIPFFLDLGYTVFKTRPRPPYALTSPVQAFKEGCIRENWVPVVADSDTALLDDARGELEQLSPEMVPGVQRLVQLIEAQSTRLSASAESRSADLSVFLRRTLDRSLPDFLAGAQRFLGLKTPMVVICDQFEEIFVHYYNTPVFDDFVEELQAVCDRGDVRVHFLFSMREDWVGSMIAFRRAIPDILSSSFRLDPIRRSKAAPALILPAARAGLVLEEKTAEVILADLSRFYNEQQQRGLQAVRLTRSPVEDPFIELPALQAVGNRLWDTRISTEYQPFSLEHYRAMVPHKEVEESGSPAAAVLEHYLSDTLDSIDDGKGSPDPVLDELRLDILYLLTDKTAHRRGLGERELLKELAWIRPKGLKLPDAHLALVRAAILPVRQRWLIREELAADKEVRYELAHDFVVRSVVRTWTELERRRIRELAILSRKQETVEQEVLRLARRVSDLSRVQRTGQWTTMVVTPLVAVALGFLCYLALAGKPAPWSMGYTVLWFLAAPALVLLTAGLISRSRASMGIAAAALLFAIGVRWYQPDLIVGGLPVSSSVRSSLMDDFAYRLADSDPGMLRYARDVVQGAADDIHGSAPTSYVAVHAKASWRLRTSSLSGERVIDDFVAAYSALWNERVVGFRVASLSDNVGFVGLALGLFLMLAYTSVLLAFARDWPLSHAAQSKMQLLLAESIDIVVAIAFFFLCLAAVTLTPLKKIEIVPHYWWLLTLLVSVWILYTVGSTFALRRWPRTIGEKVAGIAVRKPAGIGVTLLRQALFGLWSGLNMLWLLPEILFGMVRRLADSPEPDAPKDEVLDALRWEAATGPR